MNPTKRISKVRLEREHGGYFVQVTRSWRAADGRRHSFTRYYHGVSHKTVMMFVNSDPGSPVYLNATIRR